MHALRVVAGGILLVALVSLSVPLISSAQASDDLSATIRTAILSDPRTAEMSEAEIEHMVAALAQSAEEQGVSSYDIAWRPQEPAMMEEVVPVSCGSMPEFFCMLTAAFGLDGSDVAIPFALMVTSAILLFVIGSLLHHRYGRHPVRGAMPPVVPQSAPPPNAGF